MSFLQPIESVNYNRHQFPVKFPLNIHFQVDSLYSGHLHKADALQKFPCTSTCKHNQRGNYQTRTWSIYLRISCNFSRFTKSCLTWLKNEK